MTLLTAIPQYNMHEQKMQTHEEYTLMFISKNLFTLLISSVHSLISPFTFAAWSRV